MTDRMERSRTTEFVSLREQCEDKNGDGYIELETSALLRLLDALDHAHTADVKEDVLMNRDDLMRQIGAQTDAERDAAQERAYWAQVPPAQTFHRRPDEYRAIQFDPNDLNSLFAFCGLEIRVTITAAGVTALLVGGMAGADTAREGDWIVAGRGLYTHAHNDDTYGWIVMSDEEFTARFHPAGDDA